MVVIVVSQSPPTPPSGWPCPHVDSLTEHDSLTLPTSLFSSSQLVKRFFISSVRPICCGVFNLVNGNASPRYCGR
jgi:hypothetical protein